MKTGKIQGQLQFTTKIKDENLLEKTVKDIPGCIFAELDECLDSDEEKSVANILFESEAEADILIGIKSKEAYFDREFGQYYPGENDVNISVSLDKKAIGSDILASLKSLDPSISGVKLSIFKFSGTVITKNKEIDIEEELDDVIFVN